MLSYSKMLLEYLEIDIIKLYWLKFLEIEKGMIK